MAFNLRVYPYAQRIMYVDTHVYTYEVRTGSRRHSVDVASRTKYMMNNIRNAGHVINAAHNSSLLSDAARSSLHKRANSMAVGSLMELYQGRRNIFTKDAAIKTLELARQLGVYPIKGRTFTWKTTLLAHCFLNWKSLFLCCFK